jgi:hypothetical protein
MSLLLPFWQLSPDLPTEHLQKNWSSMSMQVLPVGQAPGEQLLTLTSQ